MKYKSSFKPIINAYNHRMCTLNVYCSTGNKQTNKRTPAFYKGIDYLVYIVYYWVYIEYHLVYIEYILGLY